VAKGRNIGRAVREKEAVHVAGVVAQRWWRGDVPGVLTAARGESQGHREGGRCGEKRTQTS
jgi:hypothetical protein